MEPPCGRRACGHCRLSILRWNLDVVRVLCFIPFQPFVLALPSLCHERVLLYVLALLCFCDLVLDAVLVSSAVLFLRLILTTTCKSNEQSCNGTQCLR